MTNIQTIDGVPRHWAEIEAAVRGAFQDGKKDYNGCMRERLRELRALLDAPACNTCCDQGEIFVSRGKVESHMLTEPDPIYRGCPDCKLAAQPQGEPVGEVADMKYGRVQFYRATGDTSKPYLQPGTKLYAEQTAPVAVVMPERMDNEMAIPKLLGRFGVYGVVPADVATDIYNAALADVEKLNGGQS